MTSCNAFVQAGQKQQCFGPFWYMLNPGTYLLTTNVLDASYGWSFNIPALAGYLVALYLGVSLVFVAAKNRWKRAVLYHALIVLLIILANIFTSIFRMQTWVA
jgi:hypothetical protein